MFANVSILACDVDEPTGLHKGSVHKTCCHCEKARRKIFHCYLNIQFDRLRHNLMNKIHLSDPGQPYDLTCHPEASRGLLNQQREAFPLLKTENSTLKTEAQRLSRGTEGSIKLAQVVAQLLHTSNVTIHTQSLPWT